MGLKDEEKAKIFYAVAEFLRLVAASLAGWFAGGSA